MYITKGNRRVDADDGSGERRAEGLTEISRVREVARMRSYEFRRAIESPNRKRKIGIGLAGVAAGSLATSNGQQ